MQWALFSYVNWEQLFGGWFAVQDNFMNNFVTLFELSASGDLLLYW